MFTGLVEDVGTVDTIRNEGAGVRFRIRAPHMAGDLVLGESVAVNGVCLTVISASQESFEVDVVKETLSRTTLGQLKINDPVNLERSLRPSDRLGGHFVQGHVDGVGRIESFSREETGNFRLTLHLPEDLRPFAVEKGSIAVDGVSLTIAKILETGVELAVIPFTLEHTTFRTKRPGDSVNVEMDLLGKYVYQFLKNQHAAEDSKITEEWLRQAGF
ncbi:MAG: riboflavin synthase [Calditrichaeota bacterium]|nr:riboflavin synthase [Calditrichota bacterium]